MVSTQATSMLHFTFFKLQSEFDYLLSTYFPVKHRAAYTTFLIKI